MTNYLVLKRITLKSVHQQTGKTHHFSGDAELPAASSLKIVRIEGGPGYYLIHYDANGHEITDTLHDTVEEALSQAQWEYSVQPNEWESVDSRH